MAQDLAPKTLPLVQPPVRTAVGVPIAPSAAADLHRTATLPASVRQVDGTTWVYYFAEMVVGTASVAGSSWAGTGGQITLEYCEVLIDEVCSGPMGSAPVSAPMLAATAC